MYMISYLMRLKITQKKTIYSGAHNVPREGPCIFIVAPHANQ